MQFVDEKPFMRDWYGHYKRRVKLRRPQKVVVLDLGSFSFKCAAVHRRLSTVRTASTESVVAMVRSCILSCLRMSHTLLAISNLGLFLKTA